MAKAPAADQIRLLEVQDLDTQLRQLAHKRRTHPAIEKIAAIEEELTGKEATFGTGRAEAGDIRRELAKAEGDVEQVRAREQRDREHLDAGRGTAKDLQGLQSELEALAKRRAELEDIQLEIMERLDAAESELANAEAVIGGLRAERDQLASELEGANAEIDLQAERLTAAREQVVQGIDAGLMTLYTRIAESSGGVGAARLAGIRCEGCRLELNAGDLSRIKAAADDDVVRCEECGRILVRAK